MFLYLRFFLIIFLFSIFISQTYDIGDQISIADQNIELNICYGASDHDLHNEFSLADLNGTLNGGDYHVIMIDISAAW